MLHLCLLQYFCIVGESICLIFTRRTILLIFWCYYYSHAPACSLWCSCEMEQLMPAIFVSWKFFRFMMPSSRRKCIDWLCKCLLLELPIRFLYLLHLSFSKHMDTGIFANMVLIQGPGAKQEYLFYMAFFKVIIGVGFLRYFQVKQLPNFLLASPILSVAVCSIIWYASSLPKVFQTLREGRIFSSMLYSVGDNQSLESTSQSDCRISSKTLEGDHILRRRRKESQEIGSESFQGQNPHQEALHNLHGYHSIMVLPFILHLGFMTFTAFFVMHVQVSTRFLSASPPIYWFASYLLVSPGTTTRRIVYFIWVYFTGYILLGSLLFSNFYPFT